MKTLRKVVANFVPKFDAWRLTFTLPLIAAARHVCFLVDGTKHPELIEKVLQADLQYPAARAQAAAQRGDMDHRPADPMKKKTIIVTGSAGLIGSETVKRFAQRRLSRRRDR